MYPTLLTFEGNLGTGASGAWQFWQALLSLGWGNREICRAHGLHDSLLAFCIALTNEILVGRLISWTPNLPFVSLSLYREVSCACHCTGMGPARDVVNWSDPPVYSSEALACTWWKRLRACARSLRLLWPPIATKLSPRVFLISDSPLSVPSLTSDYLGSVSLVIRGHASAAAAS